jgi:UDP:flavonoid glycosyltransferase YjiC (YdhE family)
MNIHPKTVKPRVLLSPLDWGLGHATRCIPIIRGLLEQGAEVILAGDGKVETLLRREFPALEFLSLPGYEISYGKNKIELVGKILLQIPRILQVIEAENEWLKSAIEVHGIDAVISDNRYGLYNENVYSVFITHQLQIMTGLAVTDRIIQNIHFNYINKFNACWIPDVPTKPGLAAQLSHPKRKPQTPLHYIGWQSRFDHTVKGSDQHILIMLSGPEPQRTMFEEIIFEQLKQSKVPVVVLRGLPGETEMPSLPPNVKVCNHLPANEMQDVIANASFIVARSGYSTVMDLLPWKKKTILIPTPGQTEQEYLAEQLVKQSYTLSFEQDDFNLEHALDIANIFPYEFPVETKEDLLAPCINELLTRSLQKNLNEQPE